MGGVAVRRGGAGRVGAGSGGGGALSTGGVGGELSGMDMSRARWAEGIDEHAAIFILQGALDRLARLRGAD